MRDLDRFPHDYLVQRTRSSSRPSSLRLAFPATQHTQKHSKITIDTIMTKNKQMMSIKSKWYPNCTTGSYRTQISWN